MFQEDRLCDVLTPVENVVLVCEKNVSRKKIYDNLCKILPKECLIQPVSELSGGMKRRVLFARAMEYPGKIVIMDEPLQDLIIIRKRGYRLYFAAEKGQNNVYFNSRGRGCKPFGAVKIKLEDINNICGV